MIANRIHLTPTLRAKLNAQTQALAKSEEELFLIHLRLSELALLVPLKLLAIRLIRQAHCSYMVQHSAWNLNFQSSANSSRI